MRAGRERCGNRLLHRTHPCRARPDPEVRALNRSLHLPFTPFLPTAWSNTVRVALSAEGRGVWRAHQRPPSWRTGGVQMRRFRLKLIVVTVAVAAVGIGVAAAASADRPE